MCKIIQVYRNKTEPRFTSKFIEA